ncbi:hypothetical protein HII36_05245 [Nonomuraea sp. NN258]|uniref:hypothetical protein n=1 Tax=Nonomuraea antri TaxID=2730852 RepID=UPI0015699565|nr:hypothetical protein [Nonomuraea antri]NRQ31242.1 hypothetical protein [Nonomuraea antri]
MRGAVRVSLVAAWLAVVWAAAPLAQVGTLELAVVVPLIIIVVGAVLEELERHGAGAAGISLTAVALWGLAVSTWGVTGGSALVLSAAAVLMVGRARRAGQQW